MIVGGGSDGSVCFYDHRSNQKIMNLQVPSVGERPSGIVKLHPLSNGEKIVTSSMNSKVSSGQFMLFFKSQKFLPEHV